MKVKSLRLTEYGRGTMSKAKIAISNTRSAKTYAAVALAEDDGRRYGIGINRRIDEGRHGCYAMDYGGFQLWMMMMKMMMKMMKAGGLMKTGGYLPIESTKSS